MNMLEKLLVPQLFDDLTETTWWTDLVYRGLERADSDGTGVDPGQDMSVGTPMAGIVAGQE
jgi:hypothetical protein